MEVADRAGTGRIIPAYAGSTWARMAVRGAARDHPRIRGEHGISPVCWAKGWGSSPHTRGARKCEIRLRFGIRIIPAYAGSTYLRRHKGEKHADHPRIRGEHKNFPNFVFATWGSSPHTRGARAGPVEGPDGLGIIPAYAGSTPERR